MKTVSPVFLYCKNVGILREIIPYSFIRMCWGIQAINQSVLKMLVQVLKSLGID